jgi:hypothetical protein
MKSNGRIDLLHAPNPISLYDKPVYTSSYNDAMTGNWADTPLSKAFFSQQNQQILQNGIRAGVFKRSNGQYTIGAQDCDSLKIVMRSVFLQNASNKPFNIKEQVEQLNVIVLNYCIQQVYSEAQGYMKYLEDASTLVVPIAHPMMESTYDKQLQLKPWF